VGRRWGDVGEGTNRLTRILGGRVIREEFSGGGANGHLEGLSLSVFDPARRLWQQTWVDDQGGLPRPRRRRRRRLVRVPRDAPEDGPSTRQRMVFRDVATTSFRWTWEISQDGGATWAVRWEIAYTRTSAEAFRGIDLGRARHAAHPHRRQTGHLRPHADQVEAWFADRGQPAYRARQLADAIWGATRPARQKPGRCPRRSATSSTRPSASTPSPTRSFRLSDGGLTEKALHTAWPMARSSRASSLHYPARRGQRERRQTLCISSQAGCAVGCPFCATGELGFTRDLETAEIVDQVRHAARRLAADDKRLTNVVFMGMGSRSSTSTACSSQLTPSTTGGGSGSARGTFTVSTSGVVPGIRRLTALGPQFTLAVSLHAARDALRDVLVPLNRRWPVAEVSRGGPRPRPRDRPARELRGDDDRRRERHARRRPRRWPTCSAATTPTST
jgi:hypothetical protein